MRECEIKIFLGLRTEFKSVRYCLYWCLCVTHGIKRMTLVALGRAPNST